MFQVTTRYGGQEEQAAVDYSIISPTGGIIKGADGVSEQEFEEVVTGGQGPWKVCFRVSSGALLKPSVFVKVAYFNIYSEEESMAGFDWQENEPNVPDPQLLGTKEQILNLQHALLRLDHYLMNVTHEQRYLYARTVRHLHTAQSTLSRTFWYYLAIYSTICFASFSQLVAVRLMFKKVSLRGSCVHVLR